MTLTILTRPWCLPFSMILIGALVFTGYPPAGFAQSPNVVAVALAVNQLSPEVRNIFCLSSDEFDERQRAKAWLQNRGIDAWDTLCRAQRSSDPEIARIAERLLGQIPYEQELAKHVPSFSNYRNESFSTRARMIIRLGQLAGPGEQTVLAQLTRFEPDEVLSRYAAIELITNRRKPVGNLASLVESGDRVACQWLRVHAMANANPLNFQRYWYPVIRKLATDPYASEQPVATTRLLRWYVEQLPASMEQDSVDWACLEIVDRTADRPEDVIETFDWLLLQQRLDDCERLILKFNQLMSSDARLLYRQAELARIGGNLLKAEDLANVAVGQCQKDAIARLQLGVHLQLIGLEIWAMREMSAIVEDNEANSSIRIQACSLLAELQYQQNQFRSAQESLSQAIRLQQQDGDTTVLILNSNSIRCRYHLFAHLAALEDGDWGLAEQHLLDGLKLAPEHGDLLIAMTRFSGGDSSPESVEHWRTTSAKLVQLALESRSESIEALRIGFDKDARQARLRKAELVAELNSYAWLASQTGTSLGLAEEYAREAFELSPTDGHVIDTLASCLFSQSKLDEAIAFQQEALKTAPWSRQIRNGLVRYRNAMMLSQMPSLYR